MVELGYIALTELAAEKEIDIYYGNQRAPALTTVTCRYKIHLLPQDIQSLVVVVRDFITGDTDTDVIYSLPEALEVGFIRPILTDAQTSEIVELKIPRIGKIKSTVQKVLRPKRTAQ